MSEPTAPYPIPTWPGPADRAVFLAIARNVTGHIGADRTAYHAAAYTTLLDLVEAVSGPDARTAAHRIASEAFQAVKLDGATVEVEALAVDLVQAVRRHR